MRGIRTRSIGGIIGGIFNPGRGEDISTGGCNLPSRKKFVMERDFVDKGVKLERDIWNIECIPYIAIASIIFSSRRSRLHHSLHPLDEKCQPAA